MKKITLLTASIAFSTFAFAQHKPEAKLSSTAKHHKTTTPSAHFLKKNTPPATLAGAIWSDDFSVPSKWVRSGNALTADSVYGNWQIGTAGPTNSGGYGIGKINSTTAANGFAWFDSNQDCSGNEIADLTTANSINLSAHANVRLVFQEWYKRFSDSTFVFVSNDGTTWVKYPVNASMVGNAYCGGGNGVNPTTLKVDITPTAGGQSTVWIRFEFYSPSSLANGPGCGYSWEVDDVSIIDKPADDMALNTAYSDFSYQNGGFYTQTPMSQVAPITFRGALFNSGVNTETNVILNANVSDGSTSVFNQSSPAIASFPSSMADTVAVPTTFTPSAVNGKSYTTTFSVSQTQTDLDSSNNIIVGDRFSISDSVYARDNGDTTGVGFISPAQFTNGNVDGSQLANLFYFPSGATATSISVFVTDSSANGSFFSPVLLDSAFNNIVTGNQYNVGGPSTTKQWVTLQIPPTVLTAGTKYFAGILVGGNSSGKVAVANDAVTQQPIQTSFVYIAGGSTPSWGYINNVPFIRLNILAPLGVPELSSNGNLKLYQNIPNPANQTTAVNYELVNHSAVFMRIYDVTGKLMMTVNQGDQLAGKHSIHLNVAGLPNGVYSYTLYAGNASLTKRLVVVK
ncbi:MAG: T9SS type A sorting domain-containing protein [Bacteroidia bacterium]